MFFFANLSRVRPGSFPGSHLEFSARPTTVGGVNLVRLFRRRFIVAPLLLAVGGLAGCRESETPVVRGDRAQTLELGNLSEPTDLDREVSPDELTYTSHLRSRARRSNGDAVTAHNFVGSYRRILSSALGSSYSYMPFVMTNAEAYNTGKLTDFEQVGTKALDDLTLQIILNVPTPHFLSLIGHNSWFPVHRKTIEKFGRITDRGTAWTRPENYVGNGPFVLKERRTNQSIAVEKSPTYWDADQIKLRRINDKLLQLAANTPDAARRMEIFSRPRASSPTKCRSCQSSFTRA